MDDERETPLWSGWPTGGGGQLAMHRMVEQHRGPLRRAVCDCGRKSEWMTLKAGTKDGILGWMNQHREDVGKERTRVRRKHPLKGSHKWYQERIDDPATTDEERALWRQLLDEEQPERLVPEEVPEETPQSGSEQLPLW